MPDDAGSAVDGPFLRVVRGEPTAGELAALVTVVARRTGTHRTGTHPTGTHPGGPVAAGEPDREHPGQSAWTMYWRQIRQPPRPGPGAWRSSALPR